MVSVTSARWWTGRPLRDIGDRRRGTHLHMLDIVHAWLVEMPDCVVGQTDDGILHLLGHLGEVGSGDRAGGRLLKVTRTLPKPSVSACFSKLKAGKCTPERKPFALARMLTRPTPSISISMSGSPYGSRL